MIDHDHEVYFWNMNLSPRYPVTMTVQRHNTTYVYTPFNVIMVVGMGKALGSIAVAMLAAFSRHQQAQGFILPLARTTLIPSRTYFTAEKTSASSIFPAGLVGDRTRCASVAGGATAVGSEVLAGEDESVRVAQIEGFKDKVKCESCGLSGCAPSVVHFLFAVEKPFQNADTRRSRQLIQQQY